MNDELEPISDELAALIRLERKAWVEPTRAKQNVANRLAPLLAAAPLPAASDLGSASSLGKSAWLKGTLLFVLGTATGAALHAGLATPPAGPAPSVPAASLPPASAPSETPTPPEPVASAPAPEASHQAPSATQGPAAIGPAAETSAARERTLIERARAALARGNATAALSALQEHARLYPTSQFREMRDALTVGALVGAGRVDQARAQAARFHRSFPGSVYGATVDEALAQIP